MREHRRHLITGLSKMDCRSKLVFALLTAERLRACCYIACKGDAVWKTFASTIERLFAQVCDHESIPATAIENCIATLEPIVPSGGEPLQAQGQSSVICLLEGICFSLSNDSDAAEAALNSIVDAIDNYVFFVREAITGESISPDDDYELLRRELQRQSDDLNFASQISIRNRDDIVERRIENFQYSIPVAEGFA